jgi:hypothetical protein
MHTTVWTRLGSIAIVLLLTAAAGSGASLIWGVNPNAIGEELININPLTGEITQSFGLPGIQPQNTRIGLAGWKNELFYTNADVNNGRIYIIDPKDGTVKTNYNVSGGWEVNGLGYFASLEGAWLYTSGCSVDDMHRYTAANGASPQYFWSSIVDPQSVAGDNGGRIFTYGTVPGAGYAIYEINPLVNTGATFFAASPSRTIVGMAYDGTYLYLSDTSGMLYTMNGMGEVVKALELGYTLYALGSTEGTGGVPEPGTFALIGFALAAAWLARRQRI